MFQDFSELKAKMPSGLSRQQQQLWKSQHVKKRQTPLRSFAQTIGDDKTKAQWERLKEEDRKAYEEVSAAMSEEWQAMSQKSIKKSLSSSTRSRASKASLNPLQKVSVFNQDFAGSLFFDSSEDEAMVAVECYLGDAQMHRNGDIIEGDDGKSKTIAGSTKWWQVAVALPDGKFRMLNDPYRHESVIPRIQEYIAAAKRGNPQKAKAHGRKKENKGKPHRYMK